MFFVASLFRSIPALDAFDFRLDFRVGERGIFSWEMRFVDDGILESLRFGDELRSLSTVLLGCGRRSGALPRVGNCGALTGFPLKILG